MVLVLRNEMHRTSPFEDGPEFSMVNPNPDEAKVFDEKPSRTHVLICNDSDDCANAKLQLDLDSMEQPQASEKENLNTAITTEKLVNAINEMASQAPIEIQGADICDSSEEKSIEQLPDGEMQAANGQGIVEVTIQLADDLECKMFDCSTDKSTHPKFAGLNHFSGYLYSYPMIDEVDSSLHKGEMPLNEKVQQSFSFKHEVTDNVYQVFDKLTDPCKIVLHSPYLVHLFGNEEKYDLSSLKVDNRSVNYKLDNVWLNVLVTLIHDPGGCSRLHIGFGSFKYCNEQGDYCWAVNVAEPLIISDPLITCQEACIEWSDPNVQKVEAFLSATPIAGNLAVNTYAERMNDEAVVLKYEYGVGDISSKHGSVKVLHWDKVLGGESKTVRYPFMEQSKVTEPNKSRYIAIFLNGHNVTVSDLIETLCAMRREVTLLFLHMLKHGIDNRLSSFETLNVMDDEIPLSKCWSNLFDDLGGNSFALRTWHLRKELSLSWGRLCEVHGAQKIYFLQIDCWRRRTICGHATYVCSFFTRGAMTIYLPSYIPGALSFLLVLLQTDLIGVILGIFTMLSIEVSKAIDPKKDRDEFIVLLGHWKGTDEDIRSKFLAPLSRMIPTKAVCNLTEYEDDSPVPFGRAENFFMLIFGVSFAFKILKTFLFISCLRYAVEYRKEALKTTFGEFTMDKYLMFINDPAGRWYNPTLQRVHRAVPIHLMIKQGFRHETWVVCISLWTQSVIVSLTAQDGIWELQSKQLNDQLLKCTYVSISDLFSVTRAPIVISIDHFCEKYWVTKPLSNGNGSKTMNIGLCSNCYDGVTTVEFHVFIWDPGENVNFLYILEDKDVVERVGKHMVPMDTTLVLRGSDHEVQVICLKKMEDFGLSVPHTGLDTSRLGRFELGLIASDLKHFKQYSDSHDYDDVFIAKLQNLVWDPGQINIF